MHAAFPSPDDDDAEDVAWGLTTGAALWRQGERYDAIVWLKRAVDAAEQAGAAQRADELNRAATELLASLSGPTISTPSGPPPAPSVTRAPPPPPAPPIAITPVAGPVPPPKPPPPKPRGAPPPPPPPPPPARNSSSPARREARHFPPLPAGPPARTPLPPRGRPSPLEELASGSARPLPVEEPDSRPNPALIDQAIREALAQPIPEVEPMHMEDPFPRPVVQREPFQTEVDEETDLDAEETIPLPSLRVVLDSSPPTAETPSRTMPPAPPSPAPPSPAPPFPASASPAPPSPSVAPSRASVAPSRASVAPSRASVTPRASSFPPGAHLTRSSPVPAAPPSGSLRSSPVPPAPGEVVRPSQPPPGWGSSPAAPFKQSPLPPLPPSVAPPPISLDALGQLTPSQRDGLLKAATIESLGVEEEVTVSGLAFVITGCAAIQATVAEASAGVLNAGELLYAKSPISDTISLRLVAESEPTQIALWDAKTAEEALSASPELLERLKVASARVQAVVGCSMGAMGERLDESLRTLAIERLETRILQPNEVLAAAGLPVPGLVIVGVGTVDLDDGGGEHVANQLVPGDFLFATEVLGAEAAPATARAGSKGAVVLFGGRAVAHELLVTCPPLLEIFAGM